MRVWLTPGNDYALESAFMMANDVLDLELANELAELGRLAETLARLGSDWGLPAAVIQDLDLALEEVVSNVIRYGFPEGEKHAIRVHFERRGSELTVTVEDDGRPFDPLAKANPDVKQPIEERPIGGLGIYLVRQVMDEVHYQRQGERNLLTLKKRYTLPV